MQELILKQLQGLKIVFLQDKKRMRDEDVKIKIVIKNKGNLLANATIHVSTYDYGFITIKSFQIWESHIFNNRLKDNVNIQPPGKVAYGHYYPHVFFEDTQRWYELEQEIYMAYLEKKNESEEIDIDKVNV